MNRSAAPRIETERLILRGRTMADFPAFAAMWADPVTTTHFASGPIGREDAWTGFSRSEGLWVLHGFSMWLIEEMSTGAFVGEAGGFERMRDLSESIDGMLEFGWSIGKAFYGRGYAGEAVRAALSWADAHCPQTKHIAIIAPTNLASVRVAEAVGFSFAGEMDFKGRPALKCLRSRGAPISRRST